MRKKERSDHAEPAIVQAALDLQDTLDRMERLTDRADKLPLATRNHIVRAGEFLANAAEVHTQFAQNLIALTTAVEELRRRQNASAEVMSRCAERVDERRNQAQTLETRFAAIAGAAREIGAEMVEAGGGSTADAERMRASLFAARQRLAAATDEARELTASAREAGLVELERQAHAVRQQLEALLGKIDTLG